MPAASLILTAKTCSPFVRSVSVCDPWLVQAPNPAPSRLQAWVMGAASVAENSNVTVPVPTIAPSFGPPVKDAVGAVRSTVKERLAVAMLPTSSVARTS